MRRIVPQAEEYDARYIPRIHDMASSSAYYEPSVTRTFDNEWILDAFAGRPTFFTKRMFGGLAAYLHQRLMLVLVEPTKTGRWKWHGVLVGTDRTHHDSIRAQFPALAPHFVLGKWLYVDSAHQEFESTMEAVAQCMIRNDHRFGVVPRAPTAPAEKRKRVRS